MGSDSTRNYNLAAREKQQEAADCKKRLLKGNISRWIILAALSILDLTLFLEPITAVLYDSSQLANTVLCIACAIAPVVLAAGAAHFLCRSQTGEGDRVDAALVAVTVAATVAVLIAGWRVRSVYYDDDSGVALLLNLVAVAAAIAAFVTDYTHERKAMRLRALLDEALAEQDVDELCDYLSQYTATSDSDEARRVADDDAYRRECERAVDAGLDAAVLARELLARRVASSPDEREHIINTPFRVGGRNIAGRTRSETAHEAYESMGAPSAADIQGDWPVVPENTHFFDEEVAEMLEAHDRRLRAAQNGGTANKPQQPEEPIPVQVESAWS